MAEYMFVTDPSKFPIIILMMNKIVIKMIAVMFIFLIVLCSLIKQLLGAVGKEAVPMWAAYLGN